MEFHDVGRCFQKKKKKEIEANPDRPAGSSLPFDKAIRASRKVGGSERKEKRVTRFTADLPVSSEAIEGKLAADRPRTRPRRRDDKPAASVARCFVVVSNT